MYLKKITDRDIRGKGVVGMADTPNLSPEEMQRKVEEILRDVVIPTMNENADKTVSKEDLRKFSYEAGIGDMYAGYYDKNYDGSVNMADNGIFEYTDSGEENILTSSLENLTPVNGKFKCAKSRTAEKFIVKAPGKTGAEYRVKNGEERGKNLIARCWYTFVLDNRSKTLNFTGGEAGRRPGVYSNKNLTASPQNGDIWVKTDKKIKKVIFSAYGDKGKTQPGSEGDCIVFFNPGLPIGLYRQSVVVKTCVSTVIGVKATDFSACLGKAQFAVPYKQNVNVCRHFPAITLIAVFTGTSRPGGFL